MSAARRDGVVRFKLTISREEHPAIYATLTSIQDPRRRTGRLKELIIKALTLEQVGATAVSGPLQDDRGRTGVATPPAAPTVGSPKVSVASMLDWEASQT